RILGFILAGFIYLFFIDVIGEGFHFPSFVLVASLGTVYLGLTLLSWIQPGISGISFIIIGVLYLYFAIGRLSSFAFFALSAVPIAAGLLFMFEGRQRGKRQNNNRRKGIKERKDT
ncbi:hypothetical protein ACFL0L_05585, partial [Patescibacteria group bacterium]